MSMPNAGDAIRFSVFGAPITFIMTADNVHVFRDLLSDGLITYTIVRKGEQ